MSTIQNDLSALMGDLVKQVSPEDPTPIEGQAASTPVNPEPEVEPEVSDEPEVTEPVEPQNVEKPAKPEEPKEPEVIDDWDSESTPEPTSTPDVQVYQELGKSVGLDGVSSKEDLITKVKELKTSLEKASEVKPSPLDSLPEDLAKAVALAQNNGDYLSYLGVSATDYSKVDPVDLYEAYVEDSLDNPDGTVDYEKVDEYLDSLSDVDKQLRGKQLKQQYIDSQNQKKAYLQAQAEESKIRKERAVKEAVDKLSVINGFKINPSHKQEIYNDLIADPLKDYRENGSFNYEKMARDRFIVKYYEKLDKFRQTQIKNSTKREIINEITNPQIVKPGTQATPDAKKGAYSYDDLLRDVSRVK